MAGSSQTRPLLILLGLAIFAGAFAFWNFRSEASKGLESLSDSSSEGPGAVSGDGPELTQEREQAELSPRTDPLVRESEQTEELPPHAITLQLEGRITDAETGEAIAGARIMVTDEVPAARTFDSSDSAIAAPFVLSDEQGYYRASAVLANFRSLAYAWHPEYIVVEKSILNRSRNADGSGPAVDFALRPRKQGASLSGQILDQRGLAIQDVEVLLSGGGTARLDFARSRLARTGESDSEGRFRLEHLPGGEYVLFLLSKNHEDYQRIGIELPASSNTDLGTIRLHPYSWARVRGRVLAASGEPLANIKVALQQSLGQISDLTSENGAFELERISAGTWNLWISGEGHPSYTERFEVKAGSDLLKEIVMPGGEHFVGGTLLIAGQPAAGFNVECGPDRSSEQGPWMEWQTKTDARGRFRIEGLSAGKMDIAFNKELPWMSYGEEGIETDRDDHVFEFESHGRQVVIHGFVRDEAGSPLSGARVASSMPLSAKGRGLSAADGSYRIEVQVSTDASFRVFADLPPYRSQQKHVVASHADTSNEMELDFVLGHDGLGGIVEGRVQDSLGNPIPKVNVVCLSGPDEGAKAGWTDSEGRYRFKDVSVGKFSLHFRIKGFLPATTEGEVGPGERLELDQVLGDGSRHARRVQVLDLDGNPLAKVEVSVWDDRKAHVVSDHTDLHGEVTLPKLPGGRIYFSVEAEGFPGQEHEYHLEGESDEPVVLRLQNGSDEIHGVVVDASGKPFIDQFVEILGQSGASAPISSHSYTDKEGKFRFSNLPAGEYSLGAWRATGTEYMTVRSGGPAIRLEIK
ncbi:MAG: carboxypeptidase regulatory-like domain-containing protein [Planctomycetota bacterium]|jgi:protocatechuate 3,4-dioxygenase beta subunit